MGDGISVGSGVASVVGAVVGGTVAETVAPAAGAGCTRVAVAAWAAAVGRWETAVVTTGTVRDWKQAASSKASKMRAGKAADFLTRFSLGDDYSSVGHRTN